MWRRERPMYILDAIFFAHILNNILLASSNNIDDALKLKKGKAYTVHIQEQNLGYEPHVELNSHKPKAFYTFFFFSFFLFIIWFWRVLSGEKKISQFTHLNMSTYISKSFFSLFPSFSFYYIFFEVLMLKSYVRVCHKETAKDFFLSFSLFMLLKRKKTCRVENNVVLNINWRKKNLSYFPNQKKKILLIWPIFILTSKNGQSGFFSFLFHSKRTILITLDYMWTHTYKLICGQIPKYRKLTLIQTLRDHWNVQK